MSATLTLAQVDAMDRGAFVAAFGGLFEHSPWVAEAAYDARPFESANALHAAMLAVVLRAPAAQQIAFLNMHPELAGQEAEAGSMTGHSTFEQQRLGLDAMSRDELAELRRLNAAYRERHGFPFVIAVLDHTRAQIFDALRTRTRSDTSAEVGEALAQIARITRRRLAALLPDATLSSSPQEVRHV